MQPNLKNESVKTKQLSTEQLKNDLKEAKYITDGRTKTNKLKEIAKSSANIKEWDLALEAINFIPDERERNLIIADIIEESLLPLHEIDRAKNFAKFLTPQPETQPLILIRIALFENDREKAIQLAEQLPTPLARNFAFWQIVESYLLDNKKEEALKIGKLMLDNVKTMHDSEHRSYMLRDIAKNLFLANHEYEQAKQVATSIPNENIRAQALGNIESTAKRERIH